jgi:hypothetical protein
MPNATSRLLNPGETLRLRIVSRASAPERPGHPRNTLLWSSYLVVFLTLPACAFILMMSSNILLEMKSMYVVLLLAIVYYISYAAWWFSHDKMTYYFTNERLIVTNSAPNVPPKSIVLDDITQIAVHVNNDDPYSDTLPGEARIAEYLERFNQPDRHPKPGNARRYVYPGPPNKGIIRLYGPADLHAVIICPSSLRQRVEAIRHLLGLNVAIQ